MMCRGGTVSRSVIPYTGEGLGEGSIAGLQGHGKENEMQLINNHKLKERVNNRLPLKQKPSESERDDKLEVAIVEEEQDRDSDHETPESMQGSGTDQQRMELRSGNTLGDILLQLKKEKDSKVLQSRQYKYKRPASPRGSSSGSRRWGTKVRGHPLSPQHTAQQKPNIKQRQQQPVPQSRTRLPHEKKKSSERAIWLEPSEAQKHDLHQERLKQYSASKRLQRKALELQPSKLETQNDPSPRAPTLAQFLDPSSAQQQQSKHHEKEKIKPKTYETRSPSSDGNKSILKAPLAHFQLEQQLQQRPPSADEGASSELISHQPSGSVQHIETSSRLETFREISATFQKPWQESQHQQQQDEGSTLEEGNVRNWLNQQPQWRENQHRDSLGPIVTPPKLKLKQESRHQYEGPASTIPEISRASLIMLKQQQQREAKQQSINTGGKQPQPEHDYRESRRFLNILKELASLRANNENELLEDEDEVPIAAGVELLSKNQQQQEPDKKGSQPWNNTLAGISGSSPRAPHEAKQHDHSQELSAQGNDSSQTTKLYHEQPKIQLQQQKLPTLRLRQTSPVTAPTAPSTAQEGQAGTTQASICPQISEATLQRKHQQNKRQPQQSESQRWSGAPRLPAAEPLASRQQQQHGEELGEHTSRGAQTKVEEEWEEEMASGQRMAAGGGVDRVVVAVSKDQSSKDALKWTLLNLVPCNGAVKLLHVRPPVQTIPTPGGKVVPLGQVSRKVAAAYLQKVQRKTEEQLHDHQVLCDINKVEAEFVIVESSNPVQKELVEQVARLGIKKLVLGTPHRNLITRKIMGPVIAAYVARNSPMHCTVMVISKCKLISVREGLLHSILPHSSRSTLNGFSMANGCDNFSGASRIRSSKDEIVELEEEYSLTALPSIQVMSLPLGLGRVSQPLPLEGQSSTSHHCTSRGTISAPVSWSSEALVSSEESQHLRSPFLDANYQVPKDDNSFSFDMTGVPMSKAQADRLDRILSPTPGFEAQTGILSQPTRNSGSSSRRLTIVSAPTDGAGQFNQDDLDTPGEELKDAKDHTIIREPLDNGLRVKAARATVASIIPPLSLTSNWSATSTGTVAIAADELIASITPPGSPRKELSGSPVKVAVVEIDKQKGINVEEPGVEVSTSNIVGFTFDFQNEVNPHSTEGQQSLIPMQLDLDEKPNLVNSEVERLRMQLEQACLSMEKAQREAEIQAHRCQEAERAADNAHRKVEEYAAMQEQEAKMKMEALKAVEIASQSAEEEAKKRDEALAAVVEAQHAVEEESRRRMEAEDKACQEAEARKMAMAALQKIHCQYREYNFEELETACKNFAADLRIGEGGYGIVYQGKLHHTTVAVKVLNPDGLQGPLEFQREVELLGRIHHPHMVMLLGCCPDKGCLVYEFMANGSLEDRLVCKGGSPPLPWQTRIRIAAEVATALLFLHSTRPEPIVHRDLKPGNILLDKNFVSKLGDVGLAKLVPARSPGSAAFKSVYFRDNTPVGTFAYIDPEYQRTGTFGPKSDVYALGIVMLQLLTGKPPVGVFELVEDALENGYLESVLDPTAGEWPHEQAEEVACLALQCAEMRRKNRPDLEKIILPKLDKIRVRFEDFEAKNVQRRLLAPGGAAPVKERDYVVPAMFLCPIYQEAMDDPVIAADGHTYDYEAIKEWLEKHNTSPMTNLRLSHKQLTPNHALRSAILEWQAKVCARVGDGTFNRLRNQLESHV